MRRFHYGMLVLIGGLIAGAMVWIQPLSASMDSDYYYTLGRQIMQGRGDEQPFIWNYLADPPGVPMPSFDYWMPLPAFVAALGMGITGVQALWAARLPFIVLHGVNVALVAYLIHQRTKQTFLAWLGGLSASIPLFYASFISLPESFTPLMTLGTLYFLTVFEGERVWAERLSPGRSIGVGGLCGLLHLARADGLLWLVASFLLLGVSLGRVLGENKHKVADALRVAVINGVGVGVGYGLIIAPWILHNLSAFGTLLQPGSGRALWVREYNELFFYPASELTFARWLDQGWLIILKDRLWALGQNLLSAIAVQGQIVLFPLILLGFWKGRDRLETRFGIGMWGGLWLVFSILFPFAGVRGGFFHSGAALQPFLWMLGWWGFWYWIEWGVEKRGWDRKISQRVLGVGLLLILLMASTGIYIRRVSGAGGSPPTWKMIQETYLAVHQKLLELGYDPESSLGAVNNPPTFFVLTGRPSIVIPGGDISQLLAAVCRYRADYIVLERDQENLAWLYAHPTEVEELVYLGTVHGVHLLRLRDAAATCR